MNLCIPRHFRTNCCLLIPSGAALVLRKIECKTTHKYLALYCALWKWNVRIGGMKTWMIHNAVQNWTCHMKANAGLSVWALRLYVNEQLYVLSLQIEDRRNGTQELLMITYQRTRFCRRDGYKITGYSCEICHSCVAADPSDDRSLFFMPTERSIPKRSWIVNTPLLLSH